MKSKKQFFVSLEGIDLSEQQLKNIDKGIQNVVLKELSNVDNSQPFIAVRDLTKIPKFPKPLPGIWIIPANRLVSKIEDFEKLIQ